MPACGSAEMGMSPCVIDSPAMPQLPYNGGGVGVQKHEDSDCQRQGWQTPAEVDNMLGQNQGTNYLLMAGKNRVPDNMAF